MITNNGFPAFRIHNDAAGYRAGIEPITRDVLTPGDTVIAVQYSSVNYKDALAGTGQGKILRSFPLNGGIDCAGHVIESADPALKSGDAVLVTGSGLSETSDGGYCNEVRVDHRHVIHIPEAWGPREAMVLGTAGFIKLVRRNNGPVIGVHMIGSRVGEQIGEGQLIVNWEAYPEDVATLVHAHPTMNEAIGEAHLALAGKPLHAHA